MAEAPRKITIKLRPPAGAKPAAAPAPAPAPTPAPAEPVMEELTPIEETPAPAPAPVAETPAPAAEAPVAPAPAPAEAPAAPAKPKIAIKLKPVGVAPAAPAPAPAEEASAAPAEPVVELSAEEMAQQAKRQTSRIELPAEITQAPMSDSSEAATIKLKPISEVAKETTENPQAAKSKTARIELDSVLGGIQANTPLSNNTQKTIKLKRAAPTAPKPTASAPMGATPAAPAAGGAEAPTIKLKRPGAPLSLKKDTPATPAAEPELESLDSLESLDDVDLAPLVDTNVPAVESTGMKVFTIVAMIFAIASIIVTLMVSYVLQKHATSPDGSAPTGNTLHSLQMERL